MPAPRLTFRAVGGLLRAAMHPVAIARLDPVLRERVILCVSSTNSCVVCSAVHGAVARTGAGFQREQVRAARACDSGGDETLAAAFRYAQLRTTGTEGDHPEDVAAFERAYGEAERVGIRALVDLFTFNNRFNNTWEALLPGAAWRREKLGIKP